MKKAAALITLACLLPVMGCSPQPPRFSTLLQSAPPSQPVGEEVHDGWSTSEHLYPSQQGTSGYRQGLTPEGYTYSIYPDGSAGIKIPTSDGDADISVDCIKDNMTDRRECTVSESNTGLMILYGRSTSPASICILGHDFPGKHGAIRFDHTPPLATDTEGCISGKYASQFASATTVYLRSYEWPYDYPKDQTATPHGIKTAMDLASFLHKHIDTLNFEKSSSTATGNQPFTKIR